MFERITPPKMVPYALVSFGSSSTRIAGMRDMSPSFSSVFALRSTVDTNFEGLSTERPFIMASMSTVTNGRPLPISATTSTTRAWSVHDASELYEVARWGKGYFSVSESGHMQVHPTKEPARAIDLKELVDRLQLRGIGLPVLVRFTDILKHRLGDIHAAFHTAITQHHYQGGYS